MDIGSGPGGGGGGGCIGMDRTYVQWTQGWTRASKYMQKMTSTYIAIATVPQA